MNAATPEPLAWWPSHERNWSNTWRGYEWGGRRIQSGFIHAISGLESDRSSNLASQGALRVQRYAKSDVYCCVCPFPGISFPVLLLIKRNRHVVYGQKPEEPVAQWFDPPYRDHSRRFLFLLFPYWYVYWRARYPIPFLSVRYFFFFFLQFLSFLFVSFLLPPIMLCSVNPIRNSLYTKLTTKTSQL